MDNYCTCGFNSYKWRSYCYPPIISPRHNPPAQAPQHPRAIASMTAYSTIEDDPAHRMRLDTSPIMLNAPTQSIVSAGICTFEWFCIHRSGYREGIIYCSDISMPYGKPNDHLLTCIKPLGQSAMIFRLLFLAL